MIKHRTLGKRRGRLMLFAMAALAAAFASVGATSAMATTAEEFAVFSQCPTTSAEGCTVAKAESGHLTFGKETVPIVNTITLQGGIKENAAGEEEFVAAKNGETLSKTKEKVPGGLSGLVKCNEISNFFERVACELFFESGPQAVYGTVELAAPASSVRLNTANLFEEKGAALTLPVKVKLENTFLGSNCYIGSNAKPINIELTTGASGSVKGKVGEVSQPGEGFILELKNNTLVNGTFAAPGATGCGAGLLDGVINSRLGLPSPSGNNVVLTGKIEQTSAEAVEFFG